ncbi:MAG: integrin alpha [Planctomycetes bacterium]|nr:integrin alpha [Planctomycetota bacterium]
MLPFSALLLCAVGAAGRFTDDDRTLLVPVIAAAGDLDRDRAADFWVADEGREGHGFVPDRIGRAWAISGARGAVLVSVSGDEAGDRFGAAVAALSDIDGDDVPECVVGIPGRGSRAHGSAVVFSGATGARIFGVASDRVASEFGACVANVGDFDGDEHDDFAVGAPRMRRVTFFSGTDGEPLGELPCPGDARPMRVERLRDIDIDVDIGTGIGIGIGIDRGGAGELLVASAGDFAGWGARLYRGLDGLRVSLPDVIDEALADTRGALVVSAAACERAPDLWLLGSSYVRRYALPTGNLVEVRPFTVPSDAGREPLPISAWANLGDVDDDGVDDVALGFASIHVSAGCVIVHSGADGRELYTVRAADLELWRFGHSIEALGDLDGDGVGDFAVGDDNTRSHERGQVRVYSGRTGERRWIVLGTRGELVVSR